VIVMLCYSPSSSSVSPPQQERARKRDHEPDVERKHKALKPSQHSPRETNMWMISAEQLVKDYSITRCHQSFTKYWFPLYNSWSRMFISFWKFSWFHTANLITQFAVWKQDGPENTLTWMKCLFRYHCIVWVKEKVFNTLYPGMS
jgi:hypothetical protein